MTGDTGKCIFVLHKIHKCPVNYKIAATSLDFHICVTNQMFNSFCVQVLRELDKTWSEMEFEHEKHPRTQITLLRASEELIETLEDNQVVTFESLTLQFVIILCSKFSGIYVETYMAHFSSI